MQDGVTYVHDIPYHIGRAIFVFAGGVKASWQGMEDLLTPSDPKDLQRAKTLKIPDFMSRLRVVLDIDGIEVPEHLLRDSASEEELEELRRILLKRAFIIAHQMQTHWKTAARKLPACCSGCCLQTINSAPVPLRLLLRPVGPQTVWFMDCQSLLLLLQLVFMPSGGWNLSDGLIRCEKSKDCGRFGKKYPCIIIDSGGRPPAT